MTAAVTHRPRARLDLLEQFVYLGEEAGVEVAERYLAAVRENLFSARCAAAQWSAL
jgi:plasmid stabilization system protein ParE